MRQRQDYFLVLVILLLSLVLAACGGENTPAPATTSGVASTPTKPATTAPAAGQTIANNSPAAPTTAQTSTTTVAATPATTAAQTAPVSSLPIPAAASKQGYNIGAPALKDLWVDPQKGSDSNSGESRAKAFASLTAAWEKIPQGTPLTGSGYRILIAPGSLAESAIPNYLEARHGTQQFPVIFQAADGRGTVTLKGDLNLFDVRYLYLLDLIIIPDPAGDTLHCEKCDHLLLRGLTLNGGKRVAQETLKINQSQYVYIEESKISGAHDNAIDFVAVQYGHIIGNEISDSEDWCLYVKGGSASFTIEGNLVFNCGTGGITAGQGTGFEYMVSPWLHYEAYDIKIINNLIRQTEGAGLGVNGGYNILLANNTLYEVGKRSHVLEVVFGVRSCDGDLAKCAENLNAGGWGVKEREKEAFIPSRNVYIYNNLIYNPPGYVSGSQHLAIYGPRPAAANSNLAGAATTDVNLQIKGNIIWNGPADHPLGIEDSEQGCQTANPTCNQAQLKKDNVINTSQPQLPNAAKGDLRPAAGFSAASVPIPAFTGGDLPAKPAAPKGEFTNQVARDYSGKDRRPADPPGAFSGS